MLLRDVQSANAHSPMYVMLSGITMLPSEESSQNAYSSISETGKLSISSGIITSAASPL